ncbi:glycosyltransferase family 2 protein [Jannaschia sp. W003]|uniref:glycosyltransferase family 2 protein n=1 Tax=Jannaschia sp. W003 TaxID=2867012 RepID=UPI0021A970B2|nr:glycosyltransferase family 2 protein [Jannaschia sp. W003]UWQ22028.1 glycosyltransferase family 2 protein [Jannaschia sp. W003]
MTPRAALAAYGLRLRRRRLLLRALRKRRELRAVSDRTAAIRPGDVLCLACVRNEAARLPWWLRHHRDLGVDHFLVVENASDDSTREMLETQPDVSLWTTAHSYKRARFGMDWLSWLATRHAHGHWCLTLDADELWLHPHHRTRDLHALAHELDRRGQRAMGALMLELYPRGPLGAEPYAPGTDPVAAIPWFDGGGYVSLRQPKLGNLWVQGGPRARRFFEAEPRRAPTLSKLPLVRWRRGHAYVTSTHQILPAALNRLLGDASAMHGTLLHTKFLPEIVPKSAEEKRRGEHFENSALYGRYYDAVAGAPVLWCERSSRFHGWEQLEGMGIMSRAGWN